MSAAYAAAAKLLDDAEVQVLDNVGDAPLTLATVGVGRALLALGEELEAMVELLRERLPEPGPAPIDVLHEQLREPCAYVVGEASGMAVECGVPRGAHRDTTHEWTAS